MNRKDRQRGMLLGLAVGDALGAPVEFQPPGSFPEVRGFQAGGPYGLEAGEWTDDTSLALALADSIASVGWDLDDQIKRYLAWWRRGEYSVNGRAFGIGIGTSAALRRYEHVADARRSGNRSESSSGNGSIMRLAPVPIRYADLLPDRLGELVQRCIESSLPTHASPQCLSACAYLGVVLSGLVLGLGRAKVLDPSWPPLLQAREIAPFHPEIVEVAEGSFRHNGPPQIEGSGYVAKSLEAALWAFHDAPDLRQAVLRAVNLGDDADTTGAVAGQLAGAYWGESGIPAEWRDELAGSDLIENALRKLLK